jgi:hypothetical protein
VNGVGDYAETIDVLAGSKLRVRGAATKLAHAQEREWLIRGLSIGAVSRRMLERAARADRARGDRSASTLVYRLLCGTLRGDAAGIAPLLDEASKHPANVVRRTGALVTAARSGARSSSGAKWLTGLARNVGA